MSADDATQVSLDGTDATRYVGAERHLVDRARRVAHVAANAAVDGDLDADLLAAEPVDSREDRDALVDTDGLADYDDAVLEEVSR